MKRTHEHKFTLHDVEERELKEFKNKNPQFKSEDQLIRIALFEYIGARS